MVMIVKHYTVYVEGFGPQSYAAASAGKARAQAWRDYSSCWDVTFGDFLKVSRVYRSDPPARFGERIKVSGRPAYRVGFNGQYVRFVWPDSDQVLLSHPLDVENAA